MSWVFLRTGWYTSTQAEWDWDFYWAGREVVRRLWMAGGEVFPWIPYFCGGFALLDSTEIPLLSPFLFLWQLVGPVPGVKFEFVTLQALGFLGMYLLSAEWAPGLSRFFRAVGSLHFALAGFFLLHLNAGHISFAPFALLPWIALGFARGRFELVVLGLCAGPILAANNYFMHAILFAGFLGLTRLDWLKMTVKSGIWSGLMSAPLLYHTFAEISEASYLKFTAQNHHERPRTISDLVEFLTAPSKDLWKCDVDCYWEYGNYIGGVALALCCAGLVLRIFRGRGKEGFRAARPWFIVGAVYLLISMGPFAEWAPFRLFLHFPLLNRLEVNTRFLISLTVPLLAGWFWFFERTAGESQTKGVTRWSARRLAAAALALASVVPAFRYAHVMYSIPGQARALPDLRDRPADITKFENSWDWHSGRYDAIASGVANPYCHVSSSKKDYPGKIRQLQGPILEGPTSSEMHYDDRYWYLSWTPNGATQATQSRWLLNQNHSRYFTVESLNNRDLRFEVVKTDEDLLRIDLLNPEKAIGPQRFRLRLDPPSGLIASYAMMWMSWVIFLTRVAFGLGRTVPAFSAGKDKAEAKRARSEPRKKRSGSRI